jgi:hypothetical protein
MFGFVRLKYLIAVAYVDGANATFVVMSLRSSVPFLKQSFIVVNIKQNCPSILNLLVNQHTSL